MELLSVRDLEELYSPLFAIGALGASPEEGYFRPSWSEEEDLAMAYVKELGLKIGLLARWDEVGNLVLEQPGFNTYVECGSHLDTVNRGGNYDGAAGVISGIAAISAILQRNIPQRHGLRLRVWRGEESAAFFFGCKGSRAAFGKLPAVALEKRFRGDSLRDILVLKNYKPELIESGTPTITQSEIDGIVAHLELHIEQANALEQQGMDIGVVTSIRAPSRWFVFLEGRFDHSGGTPMGAKYRRDANLCLGYVMVALDKLCGEALARGHDLVQTVGVINSESQVANEHTLVSHNAVAKVSGFAFFSLDIRSNQKNFRDEYVQNAFELIHQVAAQFGVEVRSELISESDPCENLDEGIRKIEYSAAQSLGYSVCELPSGAIHDCLYVSEQMRSDGKFLPIGMLFIPCREGISHSPREFSTMEQITKGANVLALSFVELTR